MKAYFRKGTMWRVLRVRFGQSAVQPGRQCEPWGLRGGLTGPLTIKLGSIGARDTSGVPVRRGTAHNNDLPEVDSQAETSGWSEL